MMRARATLQLLAGVAAVAALAALVLDAAGQAPPRPASGWDARLEELRPQEPERYLELAEEIADIARNADDRELARHLFALAGALEPERLGRSACLALADLEENPQARQRLLALAALLPGTGGMAASPAISAARTWTSAAALAVAEALSRYRLGDGTRALQAMKEPGAEALLQEYGRMVPGGYARFIEDCKLYRGQQAPTLSSADVIRMLRFEAAILAGGERSWSSDLLLNGGQPLIEVDPLRLEDSLNVDASRPFYRAGRWVQR